MVTAGANTFCYDRNGNMVKRNGTSYSLTYDAANRLVGVSGGASASFVYDGDGQRVKATVNGVTTVYVGDYYEQTGSTLKKYYYAGGQRVAMRENGTLYWLLTDHLGSTVLTANSDGSFKAELRYKAWGENRYTWRATPAGGLGG
jgi:YD repeat-containing protein